MSSFSGEFRVAKMMCSLVYHGGELMTAGRTNTTLLLVKKSAVIEP